MIICKIKRQKTPTNVMLDCLPSIACDQGLIVEKVQREDGTDEQQQQAEVAVELRHFRQPRKFESLNVANKKHNRQKSNTKNIAKTSNLQNTDSALCHLWQALHQGRPAFLDGGAAFLLSKASLPSGRAFHSPYLRPYLYVACQHEAPAPEVPILMV